MSVLTSSNTLPLQVERTNGKGRTVPKFLEDKLKKQYGQNSSIPYAVMNSIGAMHGNQETAKGEAMQDKHDAAMKSKPKRKGVGSMIAGTRP